MFKCSIFVQSLTVKKDMEIYNQILITLEKNQNLTQEISEEC